MAKPAYAQNLSFHHGDLGGSIRDKIMRWCGIRAEQNTITFKNGTQEIKLFKGAVSRQTGSLCLILPITRPQSLWNLK